MPRVDWSDICRQTVCKQDLTIDYILVEGSSADSVKLQNVRKCDIVTKTCFSCVLTELNFGFLE